MLKTATLHVYEKFCNYSKLTDLGFLWKALLISVPVYFLPSFLSAKIGLYASNLIKKNNVSMIFYISKHALISPCILER